MPNTKRFEDLDELNQQSQLLWCRANNGGYDAVPHLVAGNLGAIAIAATCFRPRTTGDPGDSGWIGTGTNRYRVDYALLVDGVVFHLGEVTEGGFHENKHPGLRLRVDRGS